MFDRRAVSGGLIGAALASRAGAATGGVIPGAATWSESVMVLHFDEGR